MDLGCSFCSLLLWFPCRVVGAVWDGGMALAQCLAWKGWTRTWNRCPGLRKKNCTDPYPEWDTRRAWAACHNSDPQKGTFRSPGYGRMSPVTWTPRAGSWAGNSEKLLRTKPPCSYCKWSLLAGAVTLLHIWAGSGEAGQTQPYD